MAVNVVFDTPEQLVKAAQEDMDIRVEACGDRIVNFSICRDGVDWFGSGPWQLE